MVDDNKQTCWNISGAKVAGNARPYGPPSGYRNGMRVSERERESVCV